MFEMLGNWSLGDYFKEEAIAMSFEFLTKILGIPVEMLAVTCFEGDADAPRDEESATFWKKMGIPEERIGFLPKAKNWWGPAGQTGPCGPDTEMFFWVGEGKPKGNPATHDAEWLEIWNDVFMQYNKKEDGTFEPLAQQNVDTGMGLERVAKVLQNVGSVYETDRMKPIMEKSSKCALQLYKSCWLGFISHSHRSLYLFKCIDHSIPLGFYLIVRIVFCWDTVCRHTMSWHKK
jgi:alanyl-tRNA synthetase